MNFLHEIIQVIRLLGGMTHMFHKTKRSQCWLGTLHDQRITHWLTCSDYWLSKSREKIVDSLLIQWFTFESFEVLERFNVDSNCQYYWHDMGQAARLIFFDMLFKRRWEWKCIFPTQFDWIECLMNRSIKWLQWITFRLNRKKWRHVNEQLWEQDVCQRIHDGTNGV